MSIINQPAQPCGELTLQTIAMPNQTNVNGDIFGGWLLSQMDIGGGILAGRRCKGRSATVAVSEMTFLEPHKFVLTLPRVRQHKVSSQ